MIGSQQESYQACPECVLFVLTTVSDSYSILWIRARHSWQVALVFEDRLKQKTGLHTNAASWVLQGADSFFLSRLSYADTTKAGVPRESSLFKLDHLGITLRRVY